MLKGCLGVSLNHVTLSKSVHFKIAIQLDLLGGGGVLIGVTVC